MFVPETAVRWVSSVALKSSRRSGGIARVSPTTRPGSSPRAAGESPAHAARRRSRRWPAQRWWAVGSARIRGPASRTSRSAASGPPSREGTSRPATSARVEGRRRDQAGEAGARMVRGVRVCVPPAEAAPTVTSSARARTRTDPPPRASPRTFGATAAGSSVTVNRIVAVRPSAANPGTGPARSPDASRAAEPPPAARHTSTTAAVARTGPHPRRASTAAPSRHAPTTSRTVRAGTSTAAHAAAQAANAPGTSRKSRTFSAFSVGLPGSEEARNGDVPCLRPFIPAPSDGFPPGGGPRYRGFRGVGRPT